MAHFYLSQKLSDHPKFQNAPTICFETIPPVFRTSTKFNLPCYLKTHLVRQRKSGNSRPVVNKIVCENMATESGKFMKTQSPYKTWENYRFPTNRMPTAKTQVHQQVKGAHGQALRSLFGQRDDRSEEIGDWWKIIDAGDPKSGNRFRFRFMLVSCRRARGRGETVWAGEGSVCQR